MSEDSGPQGIMVLRIGFVTKQRNVKQSLNLGITGFFVTGPMNHGVFLLLEKFFAGTSLKVVIGTAVDD